MYNDDDYYDETAGGEEYTEAEYVEYVLGALDPKLVQDHAISRVKVVQKLEACNYDADKVIKHFKSLGIKPKNPPTKNISAKPQPKTDTTKVNQSAEQKNTKQAAKGTKTEDERQAFIKLLNKPPESQPEAVPSAYPGPHVLQKLTENLKGLSTNECISDDELEPILSDNKKNSIPNLTMVVAGHVDAGKSTLVGNLLYKTGNVQQRTMQKHEKESAAIGKSSFRLAWVMDENTVERERGVTIDLAEKRLSLPHRTFTILDAPGHRDFIPNMIKGATQADVALLIIPASDGEYESSLKDNSQTKEHAILLRSLGVNQIIVVVNKMDNIKSPMEYSQDRYCRIEHEIKALLTRDIGFNENLIRCIPVSGLEGENIVSLSDSCPMKSWYQGPTLVQAMDSFNVPKTLVSPVPLPLRASVLAVEPDGVSVTIIQGTLRKGRRVGYYRLGSRMGNAFEATELQAKEQGDGGGSSHPPKRAMSQLMVTRMVDADGQPVTALKAGERGTVTVCDPTGLSSTMPEMDLAEGMILFKGPPLLTATCKFRASILTMKTTQPPMIPGSTFELYLYGLETQCQIHKIHSLADTAVEAQAFSSAASEGASQKAKKARPKCVPGGRRATVTIQVARPIVLDTFSACKPLGRLCLRNKGYTCAIGTVEKLG
jgi:elongation factor 1 alpha-like protein